MAPLLTGAEARPATADDAQEYFEKHQIRPLVVRLLLALARDRPRDPFVAMHAFLHAEESTRKSMPLSARGRCEGVGHGTGSPNAPSVEVAPLACKPGIDKNRILECLMAKLVPPAATAEQELAPPFCAVHPLPAAACPALQESASDAAKAGALSEKRPSAQRSLGNLPVSGAPAPSVADVGCVERDGYILVQKVVPQSVPALRLLCVSDTHDQHTFMPKALPRADILVHAGDFTCRGSRDELLNFHTWTDALLEEGVVQDIVCIAGNHELSLELKAKNPAVLRQQEQMKEALVERPHFYYLEDSGCEVQGVHFYGSPWCVRFGRDWAFQLADTKEQLGHRYGHIPEGVHVLVTHQPPMGQGDRNECDNRTGSSMLLQRVLEVNPLLHVFGHIHTGHGVTLRPGGDGTGTLFVNAAICDEDYKPDQLPILVQFVHEPCHGHCKAPT